MSPLYTLLLRLFQALQHEDASGIYAQGSQKDRMKFRHIHPSYTKAAERFLLHSCCKCFHPKVEQPEMASHSVQSDLHVQGNL
uniref:Uncharacterized protein n=1 Tax=Sphaerodactylus townsendi TaxID=933632 RepID=A0ACB8EK28_9SAUR